MQKERVWRILPERVRHVLDQEIKDYDDLQEIKLRTGQPLLIRCLG